MDSNKVIRSVSCDEAKNIADNDFFEYGELFQYEPLNIEEASPGLVYAMRSNFGFSNQTFTDAFEAINDFITLEKSDSYKAKMFSENEIKIIIDRCLQMIEYYYQVYKAY